MRGKAHHHHLHYFKSSRLSGLDGCFELRNNDPAGLSVVLVNGYCAAALEAKKLGLPVRGAARIINGNVLQRLAYPQLDASYR